MTTTQPTTLPRLVEAIIAPPGGLTNPPASLQPALRCVRDSLDDAAVWVPHDDATAADVERWEAWIVQQGAEVVVLDFEDRLAEAFSLAGPSEAALVELLLDPVPHGGMTYTILDLTRLATAISESRDHLETQGLDYHPFIRRPLYQVFGKAFPRGVVYVGPYPRAR